MRSILQTCAILALLATAPTALAWTATVTAGEKNIKCETPDRPAYLARDIDARCNGPEEGGVTVTYTDRSIGWCSANPHLPLPPVFHWPASVTVTDSCGQSHSVLP